MIKGDLIMQYIYSLLGLALITILPWLGKMAADALNKWTEKIQNDNEQNKWDIIAYWLNVGIRWAEQTIVGDGLGAERKAKVIAFLKDHIPHLLDEVSDDAVDKALEAMFLNFKNEQNTTGKKNDNSITGI